MNIICEMHIYEIFKLSSGHIALVGKVVPEIDDFISNSKADLYIGKCKVRTINIIGEDRFSSIDGEKRQEKRAVRTEDDIVSDWKSRGDEEVKLIIYDTE